MELGQARGIGMDVGQVVIHGRQAGGPEVAQVGCLDRCRPTGERQQPVPARVTGEVHEDIDAILADGLGGLDVGEPDERTPMVGGSPATLRHLIRVRHVGVAEDLEVTMVLGGQDRFQEIRDGVLAEIGRDVSDPQAVPLERP